MIRRVMGKRASLIVPKAHGGFGHNVILAKKLPRIRRFFSPCLIYGHITPTGHNITELEKVSSCPWFVSIRKLKDVVVSYKEHIDRAGVGPLDYRLPGLSEGVVNWGGMSDDLKFTYIIRFIIPWYVRFVAGWRRVGEFRPVKFIRFENAVADSVGTVKSIARELEIRMDESFVGSEMPRVNMNVGEIGRGGARLDRTHSSELEQLLDFYPEVRDTELGAYLVR